MKFSESWLREWVDPRISTEQLAAQLTMAGLEVDSTEPVAPAFSGVVVAEVRTAEPHPQADKLSVCQVFDGRDDVQVVCGAANVRAGMLVALARVGAVLPGDVRIKKARVRGEESFGMLCSAAELGIGDDASGILDLTGGAGEAGADLRDALALDDCSIAVELTPNRGDCLSLRGIAREVGVLGGLDVTAPACTPVTATSNERFPVRVEQTQGCPRYLGRVIRNVDVTRPSPLWLREKLRRSGLRAIDAVVDVTNYVLLELGQPLHAFDLALLDGEIAVRLPQPGERIVLLDGRSVNLDAGTLLIADAVGPVAIAGVMGGERSGIRAETRDVFVECAFFAPRAVAGTARRYGLQTDAAQRFERGVDPALQHAAIERATALLLQIVGGEPGPVTEAVAPADLPQAPLVTLRHARLQQLSGLDIDVRDVTPILTRLGLKVVEQRADTAAGTQWQLRVPSHRFDIEREEDLIEEVCRVHGYAEIPVRAPRARLALRTVPADRTPRRRVKQLMADLGYQEAITYSFIDPVLHDLMSPGVEAVALANPMSRDQSVLRTSLWPGLLRALIGNVHRQQTRLRLFELGRCFGSTGESWRLAGIAYGSRMPERWSHRPEPLDFFDIKGDVETLLGLTGGDGFDFEPVAAAPLHPGQAARVLRRSEGADVGRVGRLHPEVEQRLDLPGPVFVFELDAAALERRRLPVHRDVSRYPSVRRDLSLRVGVGTTAAALERSLRGALGPVLTEFVLFDVYHGEGIDSTEKSMAVGLTFQDPSRTLTDADINRLMDAAVRALETDVRARLR